VIVIPAIDVMDGKAVRLTQGERARSTTYADRPAELAARFAAAGAQRIHVVDLDGAFAGEPVARSLLAEIVDVARAGGARVQSGGGIRDADTVRAMIDAGVDQVVLGTLAVRQPELAQALCGEHPGRIIVATDARDGKVAVAGWQEATDVPVEALATAAERWGAAAILFTDVGRDGTQIGPAVEATAALQSKLSIPVYASGGVGSLAHLDACAAAGIAGVVLGRALYEGAFTVEEALARC
jgi:phosphoribosylformimino-5-aminoimidazole carboxamide ribotide isomerase